MSSKAASANSRKKGKSSKAERLRQQREEEERRQREEEEARLVAEQLEAQRLEEERREREEIERLEAKQLESREEELAENRLLIDEKLEAAAHWRRDQRIKAKWDRYMLCDGSPDPSVLPEINTFISLWSEETNQEFRTVLKKSNLVLQLIDELESRLVDTPAEELREGEAAQHTHTVRQLQTLLHQKLEEATEQLLKNAAAMADIDSGNMQQVITNENVRLCIWANLNKNPRFKGFSFQEEGFSFELPKPLALSNIAVRLLHTRYDHLSCQSQTYLPHKKEDEEDRSDHPPEPEDGAGEWRRGTEEEESAVLLSLAAMEEETRSEGRKSVLGVELPREETENHNEPEEKPADEADKMESHAGEISDDQPPLPSQEHLSPADLLEDDEVDLRQFSCLGGVYFFDVLILPPQCKQVNGWSMVQLVEGGLQKQPYPQESLLSSSLGLSLHEKDLEGLSSPPVAVSIKVPNDVIFFEEPQVARWDPETKTWRTDAILQREYSAPQRFLSFKMDAFHTFTLLQETYLHMPYESWELTPGAANQASLRISSAFTDIQIDIKEGQCRLAEVSGVDSDLSHLLEKWTTPTSLRAAMRNAGLNFFPEEDSEKYVSVNRKNAQVEKMAYKEMALLSPSFTFSWSKWNQSCGREHIVIKVTEHSDSPNDDDGALYMLSAQKSQRLKISESSETFSRDLHPGSEFHSTLHHMIRDSCHPEASERLKHSHPLYLACVCQLLGMTRVLTYS